MVKNEYLHYRHFSFQLAITIEKHFLVSTVFPSRPTKYSKMDSTVAATLYIHIFAFYCCLSVPYVCSYNICKQNIRPEQCHPCMFERARGAKLLKETSLTDSWHSLQGTDTVVAQVKTSSLWSSSALSWCYTCEHQNEKKMAWLLFWLCERRIWYMEVLVGHMTHIYWSPGSDKKDLKSIF